MSERDSGEQKNDLLPLRPNEMTVTLYLPAPKILKIEGKKFLVQLGRMKFWSSLPEDWEQYVPEDMEDRENLIQRINERILLVTREERENEWTSEIGAATEKAKRSEGERSQSGEEKKN